jgi:hypothetical protein
MELKSLILGEKVAAKLLAVEGLRLNPAYRRRIDALRSEEFTPDQIREALIADLHARKAA